MSTPKNLVILLLTATTVGGALLAWRQYSQLGELRVAAMKKDERADLQKRLWDLEKQNRQLQDQLAASRDPNAPPGAGGPGADGRPEGARGPRGGRGDPRERFEAAQQQFNALRELMNKPEVQAMVNLQQKAGIDGRYAALFKSLNLPPEQIEKLKTLLAERANTVQDVMMAAREQGMDPRENQASFRQMIADAQNEINSSIKATIGEAGFAQLSTYEQTLPQRNLVNELQQRLSYTNSALSSTQAEQLVAILAANAPQRPAGTNAEGTGPGVGSGVGPNMRFGGPGGGGPSGGGGPGGPMAGPGGGIFEMRGDIGGMVAGLAGGGPMTFAIGDGARGGTAQVTSAAVAQSQTVLSPPQVAALQQIQQQQQAQQQLRQLVSETMSANQPQGGGRGGPPQPAKRPSGG